MNCRRLCRHRPCRFVEVYANDGNKMSYIGMEHVCILKSAASTTTRDPYLHFLFNFVGRA